MTESGDAPEPVTAGYDGWAVIDLDAQTVIQLNQRAENLLGFPPAELPIPLASIVTPTDLELVVDRALPRLRSGVSWNGSLRLGDQQIDMTPWPAMMVPHVTDGEPVQPKFASLLFASTDATNAAVTVPDPLTGLPTRSALFRRLDQAVHRNRDSGTLMVVLFVDLDGLKKVNDRYGHEVGDTALIEAAQRISAHIPDGSLAVRFGGDEFVILYEDATDLNHATSHATRILNALVAVGDYYAISASIGIAVSRHGEVDASELIRRADAAMYRAKANGGAQFAVFDAQMHSEQRTDEALRSSLLEAIANNGFGVAAQPIFELATGRIHGVELFIRVRDDTPYIADANQLFRLAHEYGEAFDAAVLGRALALARVWHDSFGQDAPMVQINLSAQSLAASRFSRRVGDALAAEGLRSGAIAFEIDSRDLAAAGDRERDTVDQLRALNVPIIVDGFGHDSLSLNDLNSWRPTMVKLAADAQPAPVLKGIVRSISALAIPTCVKGIGSQDQLRDVVAIGAFCGQGNALTPVRSVDSVNAQLHGPPRLGF